MITSGILEKMTQSLDDLYRLVEQHADSNIFIHEVSINKKNLLKTMRELYTEHNNHLRNNQTLKETIDSLRQQLKEKEQALKNMPTENSITKHFNDLDSRAAALESNLEKNIKDQSPLLQSLQQQMKQMNEEVKKVSSWMEVLNEADSSKSAQILQVNEATQNLQQWIEGLHQKIESLTFEQTDESRGSLENLFEKVTESDQEVKGILEKVHRLLETQPDVQKKFHHFEQQLSDLQKKLKDFEKVEQPDLTPLNQRMDHLEEFLEQNEDSQLNNKIARLTERLEKLDQKVDRYNDTPVKSDAEIESLSEQLTETDKKVNFIFDFLEKYLDHQEEAPTDFQQSLDGLTEKLQQLEEKINFTNEELHDLKRGTKTSTQQKVEHEEEKAGESHQKEHPSEKQTHDLSPFHRLTSTKEQTSQQVEKDEYQKALNINNDSWFYHTLKNLPDTQGIPQPKRRPKKKKAKPTAKKKGQLKENSPILKKKQNHEGNTSIQNDEEPKQSLNPDLPQRENDQVTPAEQTSEKELLPQKDIPLIEENSSVEEAATHETPDETQVEEYTETEITEPVKAEIEPEAESVEKKSDALQSEEFFEDEEKEIQGDTVDVPKTVDENKPGIVPDPESETETTENAMENKVEQETSPNKRNFVESIIKMFSMI
ncbi:hypothetical protein [Halobacillus trueperi]|uniref:hypothetical protein n=1 Tax=Halobacillus trueperi TaxID=156205 RepID=UPI003736D60D